MASILTLLAIGFGLLGLGAAVIFAARARRRPMLPPDGRPDPLRDPEAFARPFVEAAQDLVYVIDTTGRYTYLNPSFAKLTGWRQGECLGRHFDQLVHPDDLETVRLRFGRLLKGNEVPPARLRLRRRDGGYWTGEFKTVPLLQGGRMVGVLGIAYDLTESLRLEQAVRESERFMINIFESIQDGISILDRDLNILRVNPPMERWYAHMAPLVGRKCYEIYHQRHEPCANCPSLRTLDKRAADYAVVSKDGPGGVSVGAQELYTFPLLDSQTGELKGVIEYVRDITGRVRAEEALRESLQASADIMQSIPSGLVLYRFREPNELLLLDLNAEAERMMGVTLAEARGKDILELWPKTADLKPEFVKVMRTGRTYVANEATYQDQRVEGVFNLRAFRMPGDRLGVVFEDITEQKRARAAARQAETMFRRLVEQSLVGIYILQDNRLRYANPKLGEIFGYTQEALQALPSFFDLLVPEDAGEMARRQRERQVESPPAVRDRFRGRRQDGTVLELEMMGGLMEYEGRPATIGVVMDVTESKHLEEQLRLAQRLEAVGRLAGGVAHDFNNLLMAIQGYSELGLNRLAEGTPGRRELEEILKAAGRGASLTRQLLAYSRRQMLQPIVLDPNSVILSIQPMLSHLIGEDIELRLALADSLETVKADPGNLEQVLMNLVVNARDAMPEGGRLTLHTENVTFRESDVSLTAERRAGTFVCLSVSDTGIGMDAETLQRVFEPFFSTKELGKGTGLGLAVVYGIVKQHEGWIEVTSQPEQGTTFKVFLPAFTSSRQPAVAHPAEAPRRAGQGERILVVEDEAQVLEFAARALTEAGYRVVKAATAQEAEALVGPGREKFDLVFCDVVLPDKTGLRLVEELKRRDPALRVLLSSGYADHKAQWPLIQSRGLPFLQKPYRLQDLLQIVQDVLITWS
jgi:two-component system, cell cycle sensor histidine kinase and response regulator CckA